VPSGECTSRFSLACTKPQLASAANGKVRKPALRAFFSRSQPIGIGQRERGCQREEVGADLHLVQRRARCAESLKAEMPSLRNVGDQAAACKSVPARQCDQEFRLSAAV
jgi:hypothetical protein